MRGHADAESLALYAEGLLSRARAVRIRAHLARCPRCAAEQARLTEVTALLSEVPAAPLPDSVAARLDAALRAESARGAAQPAAAEPGPTGPAAVPALPAAPAPPAAGGPGRRPGHRRAGRGWRWPLLPAPLAARGLAAAAGLVVLAGAGYGLAQVTSSTSNSTSSASQASGGSAPHGGASGKAPGMEPNSGQQNTPGGGRSIIGGRTYFAQSQTNYQAASLGSQAEAVLARHASAPMIRPGPAPSGIPPAVHACVNAVAGRRPVWMVDTARYQGRPALIIVVGGRPRGTVYVTSLRCPTEHPDIRDQAPLGGAG
jgi:Putative zinc-finger